MLKNGYIKLYRKMLDWEWYHDANTLRMFLHLLITANISDTKYRGVTIKRGQRWITYPKLSEELKFTIQQTRTALEHLKSTGEITVWKTQNFSVVEVKLFHIYQEVTDKSTDHQQTKLKKSTDHQQTHIDKKNKEEYYDKKDRHGRAHAHAREDELTDEQKKHMDFFNSLEGFSDFVDEEAEADKRYKEKIEAFFGNPALGESAIYMTAEQFDELVVMMPMEVLLGYVDKIQSYTEKKGKVVKDHYGTIRRWFKTDYPKGVTK